MHVFAAAAIFALLLGVAVAAAQEFSRDSVGTGATGRESEIRTRGQGYETGCA